MSDLAIKVENVSKAYTIWMDPAARLKHPFLDLAGELFPALRPRIDQKMQGLCTEFYALKDVSFEVKKGESVGIIGRNGSGKSTLLQIIAGTLQPTEGSVTVNGRVAALLELGSGFNPEFTGRENVYLNGAVLGLSKEQIDQRYEKIVAFADIGDFIDQPVKTYSSGMIVRLAFAVSASIDPDILIVDEALAVGDMNFQAKCMTALTRFQKNGGTVLFVSHDVGAVKSLCREAIYLEHGQAVVAGPAPEVAERYVRTMREEMSPEVRRYSRVSTDFVKDKAPDPSSSISGDTKRYPIESYSHHPDSEKLLKRSEEFDRRVAAMRYGLGGVRVAYVELLDDNGNPVQVVSFNQKVRFVIYVESEREVEISVNLNILDDKKINIVGAGFLNVGRRLLYTDKGGLYRVEYEMCLPLKEGIYSVRINVSRPIIQGQTAEFYDVVDDALVFKIERWSVATVWSKVHLFPRLKLTELHKQATNAIRQ